MLHSILRGFYTPSFYRLVVNAAFDLTNLKELEKHPEPFSTFFHEYLHFLQDITTAFGLMNSQMILNEIKYSNNYAISSVQPFTIPTPFNQNPHVELSRKMKNIYIGSSKIIAQEKISTVRKVDTEVFIPSPHKKYLEKIEVSIEFEENKCEKITFGGLCILESMAHIAQSYFYPETKHSIFPYKSAHLIAKHLYPEFVQNELYVFALCDACLMTYHPGLTFYDFLIGIKNENILPKDEKDVYQLFYSKMSGNNNSLEKIFEELSKDTQKKLTDYFTADIHYNEKLWINTTLSKAREYRLNSPTFLLDILKQGKVNSKLFWSLIRNVGSPLIQNMFGETHVFVPKELEGIDFKLDMFSAINEIFKVYNYGSTKCDLIEYCKNSVQGNITDSRCTNSPWTRVKDEELCGFGHLWKMWGLANCHPIKKEKNANN